MLGVLSVAPYREEHVHLETGDLLVIYSDGVTEATNVAGEEYGESRLIEVLQGQREEPAETIMKAVMDSLNGFTSGAPQADDITLMVAKRVGM